MTELWPAGRHPPQEVPGRVLPPDTPVAAAAPRLRPTLEAVSRIVAPTTLLTALLFYFGWVFTNARALYFGIDPSVLGYSTQDYLLRSVDPVFLPSVTLLAVSLLLLAGHARITQSIGTMRHDRVRVLAVGLSVAGLASVAAGVSGVVHRPLFGIDTMLTPLGLALGIGLLSYGAHVRQAVARRRNPAALSSTPAWVSSSSAVILAMLLVLTTFWMTHDWAASVGLGRARALERTLSSRPGVSVYSKERLQIDAAGVEEVRLAQEAGAYGFRYDGLRLLVRSSGNYFLLPAGWRRGEGFVIVLHENDSVRMEFSAG